MNDKVVEDLHLTGEHSMRLISELHLDILTDKKLASPNSNNHCRFTASQDKPVHHLRNLMLAHPNETSVTVLVE